MSDGKTKFQETGEKLKAEVAATEEAQLEGKQIALTQLAALKEDSSLAQMYKDSAGIGAANLAGELPLLKVHATGKSTKNELADGTEPKDGWFFYKPTAEEFENLTCHILTISKGFRAEGIQGKENVFNQIVGGVILDGTDYKPFIMYFTGLKLSSLWEFGKEAHKYTHQKPIPIPMFALTVQLVTEKVANDFGKSWIVKFKILKSKDNYPQLVMDPGEFQFLKDSVETIEDTITSLIETKTTKDIEDESARPLRESAVVRDEAVDDIPF